MINYLVSCDESDPRLGGYFNDCEQDLYDFLSENESLLRDYHRIPANQNNVAYLDLAVDRYKPYPFCYVVYTHGKADAVVCNGADLVNLENSNRFHNTLVYSTACLTAKMLGPELVNNGCLAFVGYKELSIAFIDDSYREMSIACENYALKLWLLNDMEIRQAVASMKRYITAKIEEFIEHGDPMLVADMVSNREALTCLGNPTLNRDALFIR